MNYLSLILSMVKEWFWYEKIIFLISIPIILLFLVLAVKELICYCVNGTSGYLIYNCDDICYRLDSFTNNMYDKYYTNNSKQTNSKRRRR